MTKKKKVLLAVMGVSLLGVAGSAFALTYTSATTTKTGNLDSAIYLYWGSGSTTASIENIEKLSAAANQYRSLTVAPESSKSVTGTVTVTYTFSVTTEGDSKTSLKGLTFSVYETTSAIDSPTSSDVSGLTATSTTGLVASDTAPAAITTTFTVSADSSVHESAHYYVLEFSFSGTAMNSGYTFGGGITISQSFAAGSSTGA